MQIVAAAMLVVASELSDALVLRVVDVVLALAIVAAGGLLLGRQLAFVSLEHHLGWMPTRVQIVESEDGSRVAFVTQVSGALVTLELPDDLDSRDETMRFIVDMLAPDE